MLSDGENDEVERQRKIRVVGLKFKNNSEASLVLQPREFYFRLLKKLKQLINTL